MLMMVRKNAEDAQAFVFLDSNDGTDGLDLYYEDPDYLFDVNISREDMADMSEGDYEYSIILVRPDDLHQDIVRGTLTHMIGPTRVD